MILVVHVPAAGTGGCRGGAGKLRDTSRNATALHCTAPESRMTVTAALAADQAPPPPAATAAAWNAAPAAGPLLLAARRALAAGPEGRVALRLAAPAGGAQRRRAARLLLQDLARAEGASLFEAADGALLLLGATEEGAEGVLATLARHAGGAPPPAAATLWRLPQDGAALLAWAMAAEAPAPPGQEAAAPGLAGLDAAIAALPPERVVAWRAVLRLGPGRRPGYALRRLALSRAALAAALGPVVAGDPDLLDHATDRVAERLAAAPPPFPAGPDAAAPPMLPLPMPRGNGGEPARAPAPGAVGVLPLAAVAAPRALDGWRERLAAAGWAGLGIDGLDAAALGLLAPAALPEGALLLLRWSPALDEPAARQALGGLDPGRLVLTGCDGAPAFGWGFSRGIGLYAGPAIEALLAQARADAARQPPAAAVG